jgi:phosphoribosylaminoimidazolecarboxamide formyltransferase / IMP cyclohydrolase
MVKIKRALISISDKRDIVEFAKGLKKFGIEIISTGGTAKLLRSRGIKIRAVSDMTGFPEILSGRVKTLHPKIHGGILAKRAVSEHMLQVRKHKIDLIDLVVVNLYPFEDTILDPKVKLEDAVEMIDIGGPAMIRSAAKNFWDVAVVSNPDRYPQVLSELESNKGVLSDRTLAALSAEAFGHTARYDAKIYEFLRSRLSTRDNFPEVLHLVFEKAQGLRYGENPHQEASFYADSVRPRHGFAAMKQLHGKELSFNNLLDLNAALQIIKDFDSPCACVVKHNSPCGVALSDKLRAAYRDAFRCDSLSAFGGIVGLNRRVDVKTAVEISASGFLECIAAPGYDAGALKILKNRKNLRLIEFKDISKKTKDGIYSRDIKKIEGGMLMQEQDRLDITSDDLRVVTKKKPPASRIKSLLFAWKAAKHVKSNAIVIARGERTIGIGGGQPSRVDSVKIAINKAGKSARGACLASDGFFPQPDSVLHAARSGIAAIIQPGGSVKDKEVIKAADRSGLAMVFTEVRHFKH